MCDAILCDKNEYALNHVCTACPLGTIHVAGDDASGEGTPCSEILCLINEYVQDNTCVPCPPGTNNDQGDSTSEEDTVCDVCLLYTSDAADE